MRSPGNKKASTYRLSAKTKNKVQIVASKLSRSESDLVEDAILEYLRNHKLDTHYVLQARQEHLILLKMEGGQPEVVEVLHGNGVPLSAVHRELVARHNAPVEIELISNVTTGDS